MLTWNTIFILCAAAALVSCVGTRFVLKYLLKHEILDVPNERSSHSTPVPRGGGIAVIGALILSWAVMTVLASIGENKNEFGNGIYIILACGAGLAIMSWIDDKRNLSPLFRLGGHFMAAILGITVFPADTLFFQGHLPLFLDWTLAAVLWVWFINLYNFMDGIDGITGVETASIGFALALMASSGALPLYLGGYGLIAAVIALGFIFWNWFPAKIFLGDVGSVPLGFFMGWLLLVLVANGMWCAALIIPMYYLCDSTFTLAKRALKLKKIWEAHREHAYQIAIQKGANPKQVLILLCKTNVALTVLAIMTEFTSVPEGIVLFALLLVGRTLSVLQNWGVKEPTLREGAKAVISDFNEFASDVSSLTKKSANKNKQESDDNEQEKHD